MKNSVRAGIFCFVACVLSLIAIGADEVSSLPKVPPELKIELVAEPPVVEAVTVVCTAPDGSLFVGCDPMDMWISTNAPADRIMLFRGTGASRKTQVFADKMGPVMGMVYFRDALYVVHDPYLTVLRDTDGDGVADQRENLIENLGPQLQPGLNDHIVSGFTLGMDNFFYISVGDKGVHNARAKDGSTATIHGGGVLRVRPDGTELEVFSTGTRNHLEVDLDAEDHAFTMDNTDDGLGWWTRVTHHINGGYYGYAYDYHTPSEEWLPPMADYGGGSPCGGLVYLSDGLPEKYRGHALFSEWGKGKVLDFDLQRDGATFSIKTNTPLVETGHSGEFRPLMLNVAPDGSLYIADWNYGGWKTNKKNTGRLWRLYWPDAKPAPRLGAKPSVDELLRALNHVDRNQRLRAQWMLIEKGKPVTDKLTTLLRKKDTPALQKWHIIWTLDGLHHTAPIRDALKDPDATVRAQAIRALGTRRVVAAARDIVPFLKDSDAEVRLQAATALGRIAQQESGADVSSAQSAKPQDGQTRRLPHTPALVAALGDSDRWIRFTVRTALKRTGDWPAVAPALASTNERIREGAWLAIKDVYDTTAVQILADVAKSNPDVAARKRALDYLARVSHKQPDWDGAWWGTQPASGKPAAKTIAWAGTAHVAETLGAAVADADAGIRLAAINGFGQGVARDQLPMLRQRLSVEADAATRHALVMILGLWKDDQSTATLAAFLKDPKGDEELRVSALAALEFIGNADARKALGELVARDDVPVATMARAMDAAGKLKIISAAPVLAARMRHKDPAVRAAAAKSLTVLAPPDLANKVVEVLSDPNVEVQRDAMRVLAAMKSPVAVPALMERAKDATVRNDAILALTKIPDKRAMPFYVTALGDRNAELRKAGIEAIRALKSEVFADVERMMASGEIPESAMLDLQAAIYTGSISQWKIIGSFENDWPKAYPVETDGLAAIAANAAPDFSKLYNSATNTKIGWHGVKAQTPDGTLELGQLFTPNQNALVYCYTEIESPGELEARLLCGSDDHIAIWLNGQKVHNFDSDRGLQIDQDQINIRLRAGKNRLLVKCGNHGGGWQMNVRLPGFENGRYVQLRERKLDEALRAFALAKKPDGSGFEHAGSAANGERIFFEAKGAACFQCHTVRGKGGNVGPDLSDVGAKYPRPDLVESILEPSKKFALGFEPSLVQLHNGDVFSGVIKNDSADSLLIVGSDREAHTLAKKDIKLRKASDVSTMPTGLISALQPEEFADLLAYLESLRGVEKKAEK